MSTRPKTPSELLTQSPRDSLADWPITQPGLYINYVGDCFVGLIGDDLTAAGFDRYVVETERAIVTTPEAAHVGSLLHASAGPWWNELSLSVKASTMKRYADMMNRHRDQHAKNVTVSVPVFISPLTRAAARIAFAFSPPPSPVRVSKTAAEGYDHIARLVTSIDPRVILETHRLAAAKYAPNLLPTVGALRPAI